MSKFRTFVLLRWPTTVSSNTKILTSNTNYSHQIHKLLKSNTNYSHQIQNPDIKNKIKRSAVGEQKLCPVFTRPCPDRHFVPARGIVVGIFCSKCGRNVDNCNFCSNCGKGKLKPHLHYRKNRQGKNENRQG